MKYTVYAMAVIGLIFWTVALVIPGYTVWMIVAAAVLIYRALTWALPILVGIACYVWWRRQAWATPTQGAQPAAGTPQ